MKAEVEIGGRYGKLTVVSVYRKDGRGNSYLCKCDCGNEVILCRSHLLGVKNRCANKSCGCSHDKQNGMSVEYPRLYFVYKGMMRRCYDQNAVNYGRYGEKGTHVCDEWLDGFESFAQWALSNGYSDSLELDRIDYNGDYTPDNCRWADEFVQAHNKGIGRNNSTGIKGVCFSKQAGKYRAYIMRYGVKHELGLFLTLEQAVKSRQEAEIRLTKDLVYC